MSQFTNNNDWSQEFVEPIRPSNDHAVLVEWPIVLDDEGVPRPQVGRNHWNSTFVRLPCHPENQISVKDANGQEVLQSRWEMIQEAFIKPITNSKELHDAIMTYNGKEKGKWKFQGLHDLFEEDLDEEEAEAFFTHTLPKIIQLALRLPELVQWSIPLLRQNQNRSVTLSQVQIGSLLANAFLCTFPRRNNTFRPKHEYEKFPEINFARLFNSRGDAVMHKIKCLCHYFRRITRQAPSGLVTFTRRCCNPKHLPQWSTLDVTLDTVEMFVYSTGTIEDADGLLQVDFANKYLGGGVLGHGCVQEEIRFVICPEMIVSKLFTEELKNNEALVMTGCERYCRYSGYASSFQFAGNFVDETPFDSSRRRKSCITAIDALHFKQGFHQFREELMLRELNKAYVGFFYDLNSSPPAVASGNWGCGAFGGDPHLKSLLQLIVCAAIKRPLVYFTFSNETLKDDIDKMTKFLRDNRITISQLWSYLLQFNKHKLDSDQLYPFIYQCFYDAQSSTSQHETSDEKVQPAVASTSKAGLEPDQEQLKKSPKREPKPTCVFKFFPKVPKRRQELAPMAGKIDNGATSSIETTIQSHRSIETVLTIPESPPKPKVQTESQKIVSLMDALNSDYYSGTPQSANGIVKEEDPYPPKRFCMETND